MSARLTIRIDPALLAPLKVRRQVTLTTGAEETPPGPPLPPEGVSHRLLEWAKTRGAPFRGAEAAAALDVRPGYASVTLGRLAKGPHPLVRLGHGVYCHAAAPATSAAPAAPAPPPAPRGLHPGSLADRALRWAKQRRRPFSLAEAAQHLRAPAARVSMILSRLARNGYPLARDRRGVYRHDAALPSRAQPIARPARPRGGSLPARVLAWAAKRRGTFDTAAVVKQFGISRAHASVVLGKLVHGDSALVRESRGVYRHQAAPAPRKRRRKKAAKKK